MNLLGMRGLLMNRARDNVIKKVIRQRVGGCGSCNSLHSIKATKGMNVNLNPDLKQIILALHWWLGPLGKQ